MPERRRSRRVWRRRTPKRGQGKPPPPAPPPPVVRLHERVVSPSEELPSSGLSSVPSQEGSEPVAVEDIAAHPVAARKEIERLRADARELWEALLTRITSPGEIGPLNTLNKHRSRYGGGEET